MTRNPHAGEPFADDDSAIAAALEEVSIPALLCSLVHMTGDPSWIRSDLQPRLASSLDVQSGMTSEDMTLARRRALPAIAAYRDGGCIPHVLPKELLQEMMAFLGRQPVEGRLAGLFFDDLQFEGGDSGAITWSDEVSAGARREASVIVIGCGMGGILAGIRLQQAGLEFTILDKNAGPGGTWWENRYPGARVDIGSHQYCYSFEPSDHWSEFYCQHGELRDYFGGVFDRHELAAQCQFGVIVTKAAWDEVAEMWVVHTRTDSGVQEVLRARFVISAVGSLNIASMPTIPGMDSFAGPSFHSARWPDNLDLAGKHFALIGAGASGFQIGPTIADEVEHLSIFQRTAQWIILNPLYHAAVPQGDRWALKHLPFYGRWYRFIMTFGGIALGMDGYRIDPSHDDSSGHSINPMHAQRAAALLGWMRLMIADRPDLTAKVVPDYPALGKRVLQDNGSWLRCLQRDDVELVRTSIERIVPDGVVTSDGTHHPADIICYATGFRHNDFLASLNVTGIGGISLREQWGNEPTAYLGITISNFPNLFCVYGPGTNLAAGASLFYHAEFQVHYAMEAIHQTLASGMRSCEVTSEAHADYAARYQNEIRQMVWAHPSITHSHYKNPDGKVFTLSPWPLDLYWEWTRNVNRAHYHFA